MNILGKPAKDATSDADELVILVHGIRTRAWWQGEVKSLIENGTNAKVIPIKYGYFDALRFWCPFGVCRNGPVNRVHHALRSVIQQFPKHRISVLAHSNGTYAISRILSDYSDINIDRLILCGSVIPNDYPWDKIAKQISGSPTRDRIVNDCGTRDLWPVLAASTTWGYGSSGTNGFGAVEVTDRFNPMTHSQYFSREFVEKYWMPFLARGKIVSSHYEKSGKGTPWWFSILDLPWKWATVVLPLCGILALGRFVIFEKLSLQYGCSQVASMGGIAAGGNISAKDISVTGGNDSDQKKGQASDANCDVSANGGIAAGGNIDAQNITVKKSQ